MPQPLVIARAAAEVFYDNDAVNAGTFNGSSANVSALVSGVTTLAASNPVKSEVFASLAALLLSLIALLILRYYLPLRTTPAYLLVPVFFAIFLPANIVLLVPIDLASSAQTDDEATRGIWLPQSVLWVSWRITYWLTFVLTWFVFFCFFLSFFFFFLASYSHPGTLIFEAALLTQPPCPLPPPPPTGSSSQSSVNTRTRVTVPPKTGSCTRSGPTPSTISWSLAVASSASRTSSSCTA